MADKCTVDLPKQLVVNALKLAAQSANRAATNATQKYGPDHVLVRTLRDEYKAYNHATVT